MTPESSAVEENLILTLAKPTKTPGKLLIFSSLRLKREGYARGDRFISSGSLFVYLCVFSLFMCVYLFSLLFWVRYACMLFFFLVFFFVFVFVQVVLVFFFSKCLNGSGL